MISELIPEGSAFFIHEENNHCTQQYGIIIGGILLIYK